MCQCQVVSRIHLEERWSLVSPKKTPPEHQRDIPVSMKKWPVQRRQGIPSVCVAASSCSKEGPLTWSGDSKEGDASGGMAMGTGTAVRETQEDATGQDMKRNPATEMNSPPVVLVEMVRHRQRSSGWTGWAMERKRA